MLNSKALIFKTSSEKHDENSIRNYRNFRAELFLAQAQAGTEEEL